MMNTEYSKLVLMFMRNELIVNVDCEVPVRAHD